jgi:hypothetical protein
MLAYIDTCSKSTGLYNNCNAVNVVVMGDFTAVQAQDFITRLLVSLMLTI